MLWESFIIAGGAVLGALSRYYVTVYFFVKKGDSFPYGTLFANITGAFLVGFISSKIHQDFLSKPIELFVVVGFLGAYTTFSSYVLDIVNLFQRHTVSESIIYGFSCFIIGLIAIFLGLWFGQWAVIN